MKRIFLSLFLFFALLTQAAAQQAEFPARALFPTVKTVELEETRANHGKWVIVDVRSRYEYDTLHIAGAKNIPLNDDGYIEAMRKLRSSTPERIVVYCNGKTCKKSYKAAVKAMDAGVKNVYAYDLGVFDWARAYPALTVLLGQSPMPKGALLTKKQFEAHLLDIDTFAERVMDDNSIVLDVRDYQQAEGLRIWPTRQHNVELDNAAIDRWITKAKSEGKTLLIYDATGRQVRWLQYLLEKRQLPNYYFLKGGALAFHQQEVGNENVQVMMEKLREMVTQQQAK